MTIERTKQEIEEAIKGSAGLVNTVARKLNCSWHTAKNLIDFDEDTKQAYKNEKEKIKDLAESVVIESIQNKDVQTAKWYLGIQARERGYAEKVEVELTKLDELIESIKKI